ncbi:hypothetical protein Tco_0345441 [Tanacetum coccineum]
MSSTIHPDYWSCGIVVTMGIGLEIGFVEIRVFDCDEGFIGAKRWIDRIPSEIINTRGLHEKAFIQRYCLPSKSAKQLEKIHNFKQEGNETLYQVWERRTNSGSSDDIIDFTSKLDTLGQDMKKLKESVDALQVGCRLCGGTHLDKECLFNDEVKGVHEVKYVTEKENEESSRVLRCQLPLNELNPRTFTLLCTIRRFNMYALADLEDPHETLILGTTHMAQGKDKNG